MGMEALRVYEKTAREYIGNPSALHREGLRAKGLLQESRETIATLLGVDPRHVFFTAGATESNSIILQSLFWAQRPAHAVLTGIEHPSVAEHARVLRQLGWNVTTLNAPGGFVKAEDLHACLCADTRLVCCMLVNNVVGSIQDIRSLVARVREQEQVSGRKIHFHTDAVQALGKIPFSLADLGVDSAAFSAHKFNGPRGTGILYNRDPRIQALSRGGEQEGGLRPGTENLPAIAAMTAALQSACASMDPHLDRARKIHAMLRDRLSDFTQLSPEGQCSPYILNISVSPLPSEVFTRMLFDKGFCVSSGSACSNNAKQKGEGVLQAMLVKKEHTRSSIRISIGFDTTETEATELADAIITTYREHA
jgi:cysteine desulfurase